MVTIRVLETDSIWETARKIYNDFAMHQSCTVKGIEIQGTKAICKGEEVIKELTKMDKDENIRQYGKKLSRIRKKLPNTIGGYVAHKMFKYASVTIDNDIRYQIWRIQ